MTHRDENEHEHMLCEVKECPGYGTRHAPLPEPRSLVTELREAAEDPAVLAAIGHVMQFAVEDVNHPDVDAVLIDPALQDAARRFYSLARDLAATHPNNAPETA